MSNKSDSEREVITRDGSDQVEDVAADSSRFEDPDVEEFIKKYGDINVSYIEPHFIKMVYQTICLELFP